jgi:lytic murein transglycosylase
MSRWSRAVVITLAPLAILLALAAGIGPASAAASPEFRLWLEGTWPDAQRIGVTRASFDAATRGLEPDYKLPDLVLPGRASPPPTQAEFVQVPADYLRESSIARLAADGRALAAKYRDVLTRIEQRFGVPSQVILAIWGRETDYGRHALRYNALRVLATQAWVGRRKDQFRQEFVTAMKIVQDGHVGAAAMRASWAGATGLTQFLPTEFYKHGVDFDGDGRIDIWNSVPDALASAAQQLLNKGWQRGVRFAYEVRAPQGTDCTEGVPDVTRPLGQWIDAGFVAAHGLRLSAAERTQAASLLQPEGLHGPAFLATRNYFVIKDYNFSDLYVLFVGHLADRIGGGPRFETPWGKSHQLRTADVERMQQHLTRLGFYADKVDGKAGMKTRAALGEFQKAKGLPLDCWPSAEVLRALGATR